jgi:hypothetical protein
MQDSHEKTTLKYVYRKAYKDFFILLETFFCMYIYIYIYIYCKTSSMEKVQPNRAGYRVKRVRL